MFNNFDVPPRDMYGVLARFINMGKFVKVLDEFSLQINYTVLVSECFQIYHLLREKLKINHYIYIYYNSIAIYKSSKMNSLQNPYMPCSITRITPTHSQTHSVATHAGTIFRLHVDTVWSVIDKLVQNLTIKCIYQPGGAD